MENIITIEIIILIIVCSLTYTFEITFGLAGTIVMIPVLSFFFDSKTLVIYSILPQMLVTIIALSKSYKKIDFRVLFSMLTFAAFGGIIGGYFFVKIPLSIFQLMLSIVIITAGLYLIISPSFTIGKNTQRILDFISGVSHSIFGISGPIIMTRLLGSFDDKTIIRNNALLFFCSINIIRIFNYTINSSITPEIWKMFYLSAPPLIVVLIFADRLHFKINDSNFKKIVAWVILFSGILMLARYIFQMI